jgi:hypothetical protein
MQLRMGDKRGSRSQTSPVKTSVVACSASIHIRSALGLHEDI